MPGGSRLDRQWLAVIGVALLCGRSPASIDAADASSANDRSTRVDAKIDQETDRMTVGVMIAGNGPYPFVVDTGAERTVIATQLADALGLKPNAMAQLHSISGTSMVPTVRLPSLAVNRNVVEGIRAPTIDRQILGAQGMLGIDTLQDQRVIFNFRKGYMTVMPASQREPGRQSDDIVVTARSRFGRLVLADAEADGQKIWVIIDSGSQVSLGNPALRARLVRKKGRTLDPIELKSVTGDTIFASYCTLGKVRLGDLRMEGMPVFIADAHIFHQLGLDKKPAMLLGMDVLKAFDRVSIDFANRKIRFQPMDGSARDVPVRTAGRSGPFAAPSPSLAALQ